MSEELRLIGVAGPTTATSSKEVAMLWEQGHCAYGLVSWTGSYWQVEPWSGEDGAFNVQRVRRKGTSAIPGKLPQLGECEVEAALTAWQATRVLLSRSEPQASFLSRLGLAVAGDFPRPIASRAISILKQADAAVRGASDWNFNPDLQIVEPLLHSIRSRTWDGDVIGLWRMLKPLSVAAFRRA